MRATIRHRVSRILVVVGVAAALAAASAGDAGALSSPVSGGPAGADVCASQAAAARTAPTVANLRAFGDCEIARRETTLGQLRSAISGARGLTSADAAALDSEVAAAASELATLKSALDSEVTAFALRATIIQIVSRLRVYVLLGPQVRLTIAADDVLSVQPHIAGLSSALATRVAGAEASGKDVTAARASLDAMNAALSQAESLASPWPARLAALTPAQYDAGTAGPVLQQARISLAAAAAQLKAAIADGRAVLADLR